MINSVGEMVLTVLLSFTHRTEPSCIHVKELLLIVMSLPTAQKEQIAAQQATISTTLVPVLPIIWLLCVSVAHWSTAEHE